MCGTSIMHGLLRAVKHVNGEGKDDRIFLGDCECCLRANEGVSLC
jgi:hypothetical protein